MSLNEETTEFNNHQLMNYYRKDIVRLFKEKENIDELFTDLTKAFKQVEINQLKRYDHFLKREITPILKEDKSFYKRRNTRYQILREVKNVITAKNKKSATIDRKSTRLNSSHVAISYAVFCLKKK